MLDGLYLGEVIPLEAPPSVVTLGDVNGDGALDAVMASEFRVSILTGLGDGSFEQPAFSPIWSPAESVVMGDFNGDGRTDLATTYPSWNQVDVSLQMEWPYDWATESYAVGSYPECVAVGDVNHDGFQDLVTANSDKSVSVLLGRGDGTFNEQVVYSVPESPTSLALYDLDGDAYLDIVTSESNYTGGFNGNLTVLENQGNGVFSERARYPFGDQLGAVAVGDVSGDGLPDIVVMNSSGYSVSVLVGSGGGAFDNPVTTYLWGSSSRLTLADLDDDAVLEVVTVRAADPWWDPWDAGPAVDDTVSVLRGWSDGSLFEAESFHLGEQADVWSRSLAVGDLNADGRLDAVVANGDFWNPQGASLSVLFGGGRPDRAGPRIVRHTSALPGMGPEPSDGISGTPVRFVFDQAMNDWGFSMDNVSIETVQGAGNPFEWNYAWVGWNTLDVFAESPQGPPHQPIPVGTYEYRLVLGPEIRDLLWNAMDQDGDRQPGETPDDQYEALCEITVTPPHVDASWPGGAGPVSALTVRFDHRMDQSSFDLDDVVSFTGPGGPIGVTGFQWQAGWPGDELVLTFDPQSALGDYELVLTPGILDVNQNALDQDWDANPGEDVEDRYRATFSIVPPRATGHSPSGIAQAPVQSLSVNFDHAMDPNSFALADDVVSFNGPLGPIPVTGARWVNAYRLELSFDPQSALGAYELLLGPHILDVNGQPMDQDGDRTPGETPDDQYRASFVIPAFAPHVLRHAPFGVTAGSVSALEIDFDVPMDLSGFSLADDIVSFMGPDGPLTISGFNWLDDDTLQLSFDSQSALGVYEVVLGPGVLDVNGKPLDQDRDMVPGESPDDSYSAVFTIDQPPRIVGHFPSGTAVGFIRTVQLDFDQAMDPGSFSLADDVVRFVGPQGTVAVPNFRWVDAETLELEVDQPFAEGAYELVIGPGILDTAGLALDQDGDQSVGESPDDEYAARFTIDVPPQVVGHTPLGDTTAPVERIEIAFNQPMDQASFSPTGDLLAFDGPQGAVVGVGFRWIDPDSLEFTFPAQFFPGDYALVLGPGILDATGNALDQDGDSATGETTEDRYTARFSITKPPQITGHAPSGSTIAPVSSLALEFDRPMDPQSFAPADDVLRFTGPLGPVTASGFVWVDADTLKLMFDDQVAPGFYEIVLAPTVLDTLGNPLDQDGDYRAGEASEDRYTASFDVLSGPRILGHAPSGDQTQPVSEVVVTFSEEIKAGTFTVADVTIEGPLGPVSLVGHPARVSGNDYKIRFAPQDAYGTYHIYVGPQIENLRDTPMDQDRDGVVGEAEEDRYYGFFTIIDVTGPRIVGSAPNRPQKTPLDHLDVTFSEAINADSFGPSDVLITGPGGSVAAERVEPIDAKSYRVVFPVQAAEGAYDFVLGSGIQDVAGNWMDQDEDGQKGEPDDVYRVRLEIDVTGPSVLAHSPAGVQNVAVRTLEVTFNEAIDASTFSPGFVTIEGPAGTRQGTQVTPLAEDRFRVTVPGVEADGTYRVTIAPQLADLAGNLLDQDGDGQAGEPADDAYRFEFVQELPDLVVTASTYPEECVPGQEIEVSWTVTNVGRGTALGVWTDAVSLSTDDQFGGDVELGQFAFDQPVGPGETYTRTVTVTVPSDAQGRRWIVVTTDRLNQLDEHEAAPNNVSVRTPPVWVATRPYPDLQVTDVPAPATLSADEMATLTWTVRNLGTGPTSAGYWHDAVYLSADQSLDGSDIRLGEARNSDFLGPGEAYVQSVEFRVPNATPRGAYYLLVKTDAKDAVEEFDREGNNVRSSATTTEAITPEPGFISVLSFQGPEFEKPGGVIGEKELSWTLKNTGGASIRPWGDYWDDGVALSRDEVYDSASDYWLGGHLTHHNRTLRPGETWQCTNDLAGKSLPNWEPGDYFLILIPDNHWIALTQGQPAGRDYLATPIRLGYADPPDLSLASVAAPATAVAGQEIRVDWRAENRGEGNSRAADWQDQVYLSADATLDIGDIPLGSRSRSGALNAGQGYDVTAAAFRVPGDLAEGAYYVLVKTDTGNAVFESDETNNALASAGTVLIERIESNLELVSATGPASGTAGGPITVDWTVTNSGPEATAVDRWIDAVYLSADATFDPTADRRVAEFEHTGPLAPGGAYARSETVQLPERVEGTFHLFVVTDADDALYEYLAEDDNAFRIAPTIEIVDYQPDLVVDSFTAPGNAVAGQPIAVAWSVSNAGTAAALSPWQDVVYLSSDDTLDPSQDQQLAAVDRAAPLAVGEQYGPDGGLLNVALPDRLEGRYYLFFAADAGDRVYEKGSEPNNVAVQAIDIVDRAPDLRVLSIDSPAAGTAGEFIAVDFRIVNEGTEPASGAWQDAVYLSSDAVFDPTADRLCAVFNAPAPVGVGGQYGPPASPAYVRLPDRIPEGTYYLFVVADYQGTVYEKLSEANNVLASPQAIEVTLRAADLQTSIVTAPAAATAGTAVTVTWIVTNAGPKATYETFWQDGVYLSADDDLSPASDIELGVVPHAGPLAPGGSYTASAAFTLRQDLEGPYRVYVAADLRRQVFEHTGEDNNITAASPAMAVAGVHADLQVTTLDVPAAAIAGQPLRVRWVVTNAGRDATAAASWIDNVYLSADAVLDDADTRLDSFPHNGRLMAGGSYAQDRWLPLPQDRTGTFHLLVKTDAARANDVYEHQAEENNVAAASLDVTLPPPVDLQVTAVAAPATAWSAQTLSVQWTVANQGGTRAEAREGGWYDSVYLSRDPYLDPKTDLHLDSVLHQGLLEPNGASYAASFEARLPAGISGPYYVFVLTDTNNRVFERGFEDNNETAAPSTVQINLTPPADLQVTRITPPASGIYGEPAVWEYEATNQGTLDAMGVWYDTLYLSLDDRWDLDDAKIARVRHQGDVPQGQSYVETVTAAMPAVLPGEYYVIVRTDILDDLREIDEGNNTGVSSTKVRADGRALVLDAPVTRDLASGQRHYYQIEAGAGDDLGIYLSGDAANIAELYVAYEALPTRARFDAAAIRTGVAAKRARIPNTSAGTYYVLVDGAAAPPGLTGAYTLVASSLEFAIDSIAPRSGANAGNATVEITGTQLPEDVTAALVSSAGERILASSMVYSDDRGSVFATFELAGVDPGFYGIELSDAYSAEAAFLDRAFQVLDIGIREAGADDFTAELTLPSLFRPRGSQSQVVKGLLTYSNNTDNDLRSPLLILTASNGGKVSLKAEDAAATDTLQIMALNLDQGPVTILPPHSSFSLPLYVIVSGEQSVSVIVKSLGAHSDDGSGMPIDWDVQSLIMRPNDLSDEEWADRLRAYQAWFGPTWSQYVRKLDEAAEYWAYTSDGPTNHIRDLFPMGLRLLLAGETGLPAGGDIRALTSTAATRNPLDDVPEWVNSPYGYRKITLGGTLQKTPHFGVDLPYGANEYLYPVAYGYDENAPGADRWIAVWKGPVGNFGNVVALYNETTHERWQYNHLLPSTAGLFTIANPNYLWPNTIRVTEKYQPIAICGSTGQSTGAHLHLGRGDSGHWLPPLEADIFQYPSMPSVPQEAVTDQAVSDGKVAMNLIVDVPTMDLKEVDVVLVAVNGIYGNFSYPAKSVSVMDWPDGRLYHNGEIDGRGKWRLELTLSGLPSYDPPPGSSEKSWTFRVTARTYKDEQVYADLQYFYDSDPAPPDPPGEDEDSNTTSPANSQDPNDKLGVTGYSDPQYVAEGALLPYTILFENKPEATASAVLVSIQDQLDPDLDWSTFELSDMQFGNYSIAVPAGRSYYQTRLDLRPDGNNLLVDVEAGLDPQTGLVTWTLTAIDPATGELSDDPLAGFLPPNDPATHGGEGFVSYLVRPNADLASGVEIANMATIVFDWNEPIDTPTVVNRIDALPPASSIDPLPGVLEGETFQISWAGADDPEGAGIRSFDVYVSDNNDPYQLWLGDTTAFSGTFVGQFGHAYRFYSVATDNVGHRETPPAGPDAAVTLLWPIAMESGPDQTADEGQPIGLPHAAYAFGGPADMLALLIDWGDGTVEPGLLVPGSGGGTVANVHAYADDGSYLVTLTLSDGVRAALTDSLTVTVRNVAPSVAVSLPSGVVRGRPFVLAGSFTDAGADAWSAVVDFGDGSGLYPLTLNADKTFSLTHVYTRVGNYTVNVTVTDDDLGVGALSRVVGVAAPGFADTIGVYDPRAAFNPCASRFYLKHSNAATGNDVTEVELNGNLYGGHALVGDWNGDGVDTGGAFDPGRAWFYLKDSNDPTAIGFVDFGFGVNLPAWLPIAGDWDGDGIDTYGLFDPSRAWFYLKNSNDATGANLVDFGFGVNLHGWLPIAGDWDGDGVDTIGLFNPSNSHFYLKNSNDATANDLIHFGFGVDLSGWRPLAGDWDQDGTDTVGLFSPSNAHFYLKNSHDAAGANLVDFGFDVNLTGWLPIAGRWVGPSQSLVAAAAASPPALPALSLTEAQLYAIADEAIRRWAASGLSASQLNVLRAVPVKIADLLNAELGRAEDGAITLDRDAAGRGWFVDPTPDDDEEFSSGADTAELRAIDASVADRYDLLTAVLHEMGHVLGRLDLDAAGDSLMAARLQRGIRRLPSTADLVLARF